MIEATRSHLEPVFVMLVHHSFVNWQLIRLRHALNDHDL